MYNYEKIFDNLKQLEGQEFNYNDIICCFEDVEEEVEVSKCCIYSNFEGQGRCILYNIYVNLPDEPIFEMYVNANNEIVKVLY